MQLDRRQYLAGIVSSTALLAGCSGGGSGGGSGSGGYGSGGSSGDETTTATATSTTSGSAGDTTIAMKNTTFNPVRASVAPGTTVTWVNKDSYAHDVVSAQFHDKATTWEFSKDLDGGGSVSYTFEKSGIYEYYCTVHSKIQMCGVVLVGDVSLEKPLPCESDDGSY